MPAEYSYNLRKKAIQALDFFRNSIYGEKFLGEAQASDTEYSNVFEKRSSASTTKLPLKIEFRKKSNVIGLLKRFKIMG